MSVARHLQLATGSLWRIIKTLHPLRKGLVEISGPIAIISAAEAKEIIRTLPENPGSRNESSRASARHCAPTRALPSAPPTTWPN
ncbi:hypothetical protein GCM10009670_10190 [Citricoccus alkalitolerans]